MKIKLYLIRHGLSCCNVMHHPKLKHMAIVNAFHKDPYLTKKGEEQSIKAGKYIENKIPNPDIVITSPLIRAMETGLCMFPNNKIHVAPYICEKRPNAENLPYKWKTQKQRLEDIDIKLNRISHREKIDGLTKSNFPSFIDHLLQQYNVENKNICIVTHSLLMMEILNLKTRMNNNAVYEVIVDTNNYTIDSYKLIFSGYIFPKEVNYTMTSRT